MKLIDADRGVLTVKMTAEEWDVIGGVFQMVDALPDPDWETSTDQAETAITREQYSRVYRELVNVLRQPGGRDYFVGKVEG